MYRIYYTLLFLCFTVHSSAQNTNSLLPFKAPNGLYGYKNASDQIVVEAQYEEASSFKGNYAFVKSNQAWGLLNAKGKIVIPTAYENLGWSLSKETPSSIYDEILGYKLSGKWGLISTRNKIITPPQYDILQPFADDKVKAGILSGSSATDTLFGIIHTQGKEIIPLQYHLLEATSRKDVLLAGLNKIYHQTPAGQVECLVKSYGLVSWANTLVLPIAHKRVEVTDQGIKVTPFHTWNVIGEKDSTLATYTLDSVYAVSSDLYAFISDGKPGIVENLPVLLAGKALLKPEQKGFIRIKSGNKYGVMIKEAAGLQNFLPAAYDSICIDTEEFIRAGVNKGHTWEWEILKKDNQTKVEVTQQAYTEIEAIADRQLIKVKNKKLYGYIDRQGAEVIPVQYDSLSSLADSLCVAVYKGKYGILHQNGKWVFEPKADYFAGNGVGYFIRKINGKYEVVSRTGKVKYSTTEPLQFLADGSIAIRQKNKYGRISPAGVPCVPPIYDSISSMTPEQTFWAYAGKNIYLYKTDGEILMKPGSGIEKIVYVPGHEFIPAQISGKYGFVDGFGRLRLSNRYESVRQFEGNLAAIKLAGKWGFVTKQDKIAVQPYYDEVKSFVNEHVIARKGDKYGIIDDKGKIITPFSFDKITRHATGNYVVEQKGKQGMLNKKGFEIVYAKYDEVLPQEDNKVIVKQSNKYGLLDEKGVLVVPVAYNAIVKNPFSAIYLLHQAAQPFILEDQKVNSKSVRK